MSLIAFRPVATVSAKTEEGSAIDSLRFAPTPATEARLGSHRLVFRAHPGGFRLAAQHDLKGDGGSIVPIAEPLSLLFAITSSDAGFMARHVAAETAKAAPNLFLTNRSATGTPQAGPALSREDVVGARDRARIVPRRHRARIPLPSSARPTRIELRPYFGGAMIGDPIPIEAGAKAEAADITVALETQPGLAFLLRAKPEGGDQLIVADDELVQMRPLGALELVLKPFPGTAPAEGRAFTATFAK